MGFLSGILGGKKDKTGDKIAKVSKAILMEKIRQSELFTNLPEANMEDLFSNMETINVSKGDVLIKEGDEGDYFYLLVSGTADVTRKQGSEQKLLAQLDEPKGFGEDALISNAKRNATITMTSNGVVMRLSKDSFNDNVKDPMITWASPADAQKRIAAGAKWLDTREEEQIKHERLHGSESLPFKEIRSRLNELDKAQEYVCYCDNGRLSSTACFILTQHGFNTCVLRGGLAGLKRAGIA